MAGKFVTAHVNQPTHDHSLVFNSLLVTLPAHQTDPSKFVTEIPTKLSMSPLTRADQQQLACSTVHRNLGSNRRSVSLSFRSATAAHEFLAKSGPVTYCIQGIFFTYQAAATQEICPIGHPNPVDIEVFTTYPPGFNTTNGENGWRIFLASDDSTMHQVPIPTNPNGLRRWENWELGDASNTTQDTTALKSFRTCLRPVDDRTGVREDGSGPFNLLAYNTVVYGML